MEDIIILNFSTCKKTGVLLRLSLHTFYKALPVDGAPPGTTTVSPVLGLAVGEGLWVPVGLGLVVCAKTVPTAAKNIRISVDIVTTALLTIHITTFQKEELVFKNSMLATKIYN